MRDTPRFAGATLRVPFTLNSIALSTLVWPMLVAAVLLVGLQPRFQGFQPCLEGTGISGRALARCFAATRLQQRQPRGRQHWQLVPRRERARVPARADLRWRGDELPPDAEDIDSFPEVRKVRERGGVCFRRKAKDEVQPA